MTIKRSIKSKIDDIDVNKKLISKKKAYNKKCLIKYFIWHNDNNVLRPLCIKLCQMIRYVKCFDSSKAVSFKVGSCLEIRRDKNENYAQNNVVLSEIQREIRKDKER